MGEHLSSTPDAKEAPVPRKRPGASWPLDYEGEFNVPVMGLALTVLFLGGGLIHQTVEGVPVTWAWVAIVFSVVIGLPCGVTLLEQWRDIRFRRWILAHWHDILADRAVLDGVTVGPETELVRYRVVLSMFFIHVSTPSRPVLPGTNAAAQTRWLSTAITALAGWWFLLSGPIRSIGALRDNFTDRPTRIRMADIANATAHSQPLDDAKLDA